MLALVLYSAALQASDIALVGGTLVDVDHAGSSTDDQVNVTILIHDGIITAVGPRGSIKVPAAAQRIDIAGRYVVPGLIDGFGGLRTQAFADAYLYEGVTSVVVTRSPAGMDGEQIIADLPSGPRLLRGATIGGYSPDGAVPAQGGWADHRIKDKALTNTELVAEINRYAQQGYRALTVSLDVLPEQFPAVLEAARRHHMATFGEPAYTTYEEAIHNGIGALVRNDHYETVFAPAGDRSSYANDPNGPGVSKVVRAVCSIPLESKSLSQFAQQLAHTGTALMPVLTIESTADDLGAPNPWTLRSAVFVNPSDLDDPVDPSTGARPYLASHLDRKEALQACARHREDVDTVLAKQGALYLAGSGSPAFGIMPGGGLHQELRLLQKIGLTPRQALAAATSSYADLFHWSDIGRIEAGRIADVLVVGSDPRRDVAALDDLEIVIRNGQVVDRAALLARANGRKPTIH
jgi:hypothetical protein